MKVVIKKKIIKSLHKRECRRHGKMSIDNFYKCTSPNGGYYYRCKYCCQDIYKRNRKYILEYARWYSKRYYKKNKEKILRKAKKDYKRNGSKKSEYYKKHREDYLQRSALYYWRNPDKFRRYSLLYYRKNRERLLKQMKEYRQRKLN